jgi:hypothetical protein
MCDAFLFGGRPWVFCPIAQIRSMYLDFAKVVDQLDVRYDYTEILSKMRLFAYDSTQSFVNAIKRWASTGVLSQIADVRLSIDTAPIASLLQTVVAVMHQNTFTPSPLFNDEWTMTRASSLVSQLSLPLEKRLSYSLTPQILQARTGQSTDAVFQRGSIAELLFSNSAGDVMPLPFASCRAELPAQGNVQFAHAAVRRFVAGQLMRGKFKRASESSLDVLTDVALFEIKAIAEAAAVIRKGSKVNAKAVMMQALRSRGVESYAPRTMSFAGHP